MKFRGTCVFLLTALLLLPAGRGQERKEPGNDSSAEVRQTEEESASVQDADFIDDASDRPVLQGSSNVNPVVPPSPSAKTAAGAEEQPAKRQPFTSVSTSKQFHVTGMDSLLAGAIGFGLRRFPPEKPGAGTLLPAMACAAALGSLALGPLVLGVAACAATEYLLCCQGKGRAALALCAATGAALCAVDPELAPAAAGLSCATGAAALLAPGRRVEALAAYAGGCVTGALCVQPPGNAFSALLSAGAGLGVVCFLPRQWLTPAGPEEPPGEPPQEERPRLSVAATRLEAVAESLSSLAETVNEVYDAFPRRCENFRWVIDNTHDTLCANCGRRESCWKQEYAATLEGMEALRPVLEQQGHLEPNDLPGQLSRCIHPAALCATATRSFALYRSRKEAHVHAEALRTALTEQYSAVADALGVLSEQLGRPGTPEPYKSGRVASFFTSLGLSLIHI